MRRTSVGNGEGKAMKTPVVIGIVVALHCVALGTLTMTQGCGTSKGGSSGPVQFQDKPAVLPRPAVREVMPDKVAKPHPKPFVKADETEASEVAPIDKPAKAEKTAKIDKAEKSADLATKSYKVKSGDSVGYIAQRFKVTVNEIKELNPTIKNIAKIREGQTIKLPAYVNLNAPAPKRHIKPKPVEKPVDALAPVFGGTPTPVVAAGEYVVVNGDFPEKIAKKCGVKLADLLKVNQIADPKKLKIGQKLVVPGAAVEAVAPAGAFEPAPITPFGPTSSVPGVAPIAPLAPLEPAGELRPIAPIAPMAPAAPGVKPTVPGAKPVVGPAALAPALKNTVMQKHLVAPGETLKDIAMLYTVTVNDIMRANGMTSETVAPGQSLNIPPAQ